MFVMVYSGRLCSKQNEVIIIIIIIIIIINPEVASTFNVLLDSRILRRIPLNVRAISAKNIYQKTTRSTVTF